VSPADVPSVVIRSHCLCRLASVVSKAFIGVGVCRGGPKKGSVGALAPTQIVNYCEISVYLLVFKKSLDMLINLLINRESLGVR
jgi:hypothetical protein